MQNHHFVELDLRPRFFAWQLNSGDFRRLCRGLRSPLLPPQLVSLAQTHLPQNLTSRLALSAKAMLFCCHPFLLSFFAFLLSSFTAGGGSAFAFAFAFAPTVASHKT